ncbi:MAG: hypothetical protein BAA01_06225 [Bacillus thermozeamaize]|uniref:Aminoglycoside phosphotransferase domain-containing protein n=1 Tax=Bacillus thermozeamaize TaxID=230954 RepID=A0A1Y3PPJ6_9BACI|nr:MAG: hypothetical protein BAA01_06225 [Bacillus thermozeamaize]
MRTDALREVAIVLRQYPLRVTGVASRERGYLVQTPQATGWLQAWRKRSRLKNFLTVYHVLMHRNSPFPLPLVRTKQRQWAVITSRRAYTLCRWPEQAEPLAAPQTTEEYARWGELLGRLHRELQEARMSDGQTHAGSRHEADLTGHAFEAWLQKMRTRRQKVLEVRKEWQEVPGLPEEERLFLRNVPQMMERIDTAIWILEDLKHRPVPSVCVWTLGELADSFLLLSSGEVKLAPWKSFLPGNGLSDLGRLLLSAWDSPELERAVRSAVGGYERQIPLTAEGFQALLAYVMFPHALWSLLQQADQNQALPSERLASGLDAPAKRLPADLDTLRNIYRTEQRLRPVYAWLNRQIAERRAKIPLQKRPLKDAEKRID